MVYLNRIYTKSGDAGETGLGDGSRVAKNSARVEAIGTVDELNAGLGLLIVHSPGCAEAELIRLIQNDLFDVGADLCVPSTVSEAPEKCLRVTSGQVERLEKEIDRINERLSPLHSFVLPGGSMASAWCHYTRTICRRAERCIVTLMNSERLNPEVLKYVNRLSDLLFVLARAANNDGANDVLWIPGSGCK